MKLINSNHISPKSIRVCGDIKKCTPVALVAALKSLNFHDVWISVLDWDTQVFIQFGYSPAQYGLFNISTQLGRIRDYEQTMKDIFFCEGCNTWSISEESRQKLIEWSQSQRTPTTIPSRHLAVPLKGDNYFALDIDKLQITKLNGYSYFYFPDHPLAAQNGLVSLQRHIVSVQIKRWLTPDEVVVFVNGNCQDTRPENLTVTTRAGLMTLNAKHPPRIELVCAYCNNVYTESPAHANRRHYCSKKCSVAASRKFEITAKELEQLVWGLPTTRLAALLGISDKAIEKRCKRLNISKPPPGYWSKLSIGHILILR